MTTKIELIQKGTQRLFISILWLIIASALILAWCVFSGQAVPIWIVVMAFGVCGGFISVQRRLKTFEDDDLQLLAISWPYVFLSPVAGGVLSTILYMLFVSELLSGHLFPAFIPGSESGMDFSRLMNCTAKDYTDYAKLTFWSFVAGFSESFVTDIIGSFAKSAQEQSK